jgi:hypothetical protein
LKENFDRFNSHIYKEKEMADSRRCILAFVALTLLLGLVPAANAQNAAFQCVANAAVPPTLRQEGLTELAGDIVLNCNGGVVTPPGQVVPQANIQVFYGGTNVTSRLLSGTKSEATLLVDEPSAGTAKPCLVDPLTGTCPIIGVGFTGNPNEFKPGGGAGGVSNPNAWQGIVSGNSVQFVGIPVDPPGTQSTRVYRITNVRINANSIPAGPLGTPGQVVAFISATPATSPSTGLTSSFPINNPQQIVGFVLPSLSTSIVGATSATLGRVVQQCFGISGISGAAFGTIVNPALRLRYTELFQTAFKPVIAGPWIGTTSQPGPPTTSQQNTPGLIYNSESGYTNQLLLGGGFLNAAGLADFGTRLKAVFNNIPNGVSVFVSIDNQNSTAAPQIIPTGADVAVNRGQYARLTSSATGTFSAVAANSLGTTASGEPAGAWKVPLSTTGSGQAVWEILSSDPLVSQSYDFNVWFVASPSPATNSPAIGTGSVNLSYAPTPSDSGLTIAQAGAAQTGPIPRFADTSTGTNVIQIVPCRTNLLYPYVTNQVGFDTGLAISNTSTDPFGTSAQAGTCTLNFYGTNAPAAITTPSVASGTVYTTLASTAAPNFGGYVIAVCNFQYAHGFAFISDLGARNLAMGYLALIIPDPARSAFPFECGGGSGIAGCVPSGEQLGY